MIRTRFAPSPTGYLHVGGLRTALYNYLFARKEKGTFILRIEDTDQKRFVEGAVESLIQTLKTVGLDYDEGPFKDGKYGPYIQSERTDIYRRYADELLEKKAAYRCFCTAERLEEMRNKQSANKQAPMYDRTCLQLNEAEIKARLDAGEPFVIRQKMPLGQVAEFTDLIRGAMKFSAATLDDHVLMKSDNFPTYHLANVIDDHLMEITHVIRGEEWLPSAPKHVLLYKAFGWDIPLFAHIPLLLNADKTKLSKRQGDVSAEDYLNKGYSKEAILNFVAFLGWHPGEGSEDEIYTLEQLIEKFSIEKVHKAGAVFDIEKLNWFNFHWQKKHHYQKLAEIAGEIDPAFQTSLNQKNETVYSFSSPEKQQQFSQKRAGLLFNLCEKHLPPKYLEDLPLLHRALLTVEEKILKKPADIQAYLEFYYSPKDYTEELLLSPKMKVDKETAKTALQKSLETLKNLNDYGTTEAIQAPLLNLVQELGLKNGQVLWPIRVVLSGEEFSPGTFELIWVLGKDETLKRISNALTKL